MTAGRKLALFLYLLAICWFSSSSLIAQDKEEDARPEGLSESVTVTAIRVEAKLMKTPVAVE